MPDPPEAPEIPTQPVILWQGEVAAALLTAEQAAEAQVEAAVPAQEAEGE